MARQLIDSWGDYQTAIDRLLAVASHKICIYDEDLAQLKLDSPARLDRLKRLLNGGGTSPRLQIAVRNSEPLRRQHPSLLNLLATHGHLFAMQQTAPQLAHLRDAMIIVDDSHGLIRFERDLPRSKLLIDENEELKPYRSRFTDLWNEGGGEAVNTTVLGL
jgi:hypothetical protein